MWSKLQKQVENLFMPELNLRVHCAVYRKKTQWSELTLPRYFFQLGEKIIWDCPKDFVNGKGFCLKFENDLKEHYPKDFELIRKVSDIFREYLNCPKDKLLTHDFQDVTGVSTILLLADRRISRFDAIKLMFAHLDDHDAVHELASARDRLYTSKHKA